MSATRLEPGCEACQAWLEANRIGDQHLHYEECWSTESLMERRVISTPFTKLLELLEAAPAPPEVVFDFVAERRGLDYVEAVRSAAP